MGQFNKTTTPDWFDVPRFKLGWDTSIFPETVLPSGKIAWVEADSPENVVDKDGKNPFLRVGFTHISGIETGRMTAQNGVQPTTNQKGFLFGDSTIGSGNNSATWNLNGYVEVLGGRNLQIAVADFESFNYGAAWTQAEYDNWAILVKRALDFKDDAYVGCWGQGVVHSISPRLNGGALFNRNKYLAPSNDLNPLFNYNPNSTTGKSLNLGMQQCYYSKDGISEVYDNVYGIVQEHELAKLAKPNIKNIWTMWTHSEPNPPHPMPSLMLKKADGSVVVKGEKLPPPPTYFYMLVMFALTFGDGFHIWGTKKCTEDASIASSADDDQGYNTQYWWIYTGLMHYVMLAMWQVSQHRTLIEATGTWEMPEFSMDNGTTWQTGNNIFPSFCYVAEHPIIRIKKVGNICLIVGASPFNLAEINVKVRDTAHTFETDIKLYADYPTIGTTTI